MNAGAAVAQAGAAVQRQLACRAASAGSTGAAALQMQGKVLSVQYLREDGKYEVRSMAAAAFASDPAASTPANAEHAVGRGTVQPLTCVHAGLGAACVGRREG